MSNPMNQDIEKKIKEFEEKFGKDSELVKFLVLKYGTHVFHEPMFEAQVPFLRTALYNALSDKEREVREELFKMPSGEASIVFVCKTDGLNYYQEVFTNSTK